MEEYFFLQVKYIRLERELEVCKEALKVIRDDFTNDPSLMKDIAHGALLEIE